MVVVVVVSRDRRRGRGNRKSISVKLVDEGASPSSPKKGTDPHYRPWKENEWGEEERIQN